MSGRRRSAFALAAVLMLIIGCTPVQAPAGPEVTTPALHAASLQTADGLHLPLRSWLPESGPPDAVIIALHGFNDYSAFFDDIGLWFAARGIASYAYDQRGFGSAPERGLWAGTAAMTADVHAAVAAVRQRHPDTPVYLFGESMGGAVVMVAMAEADPPKVDGAILAAPAVWGRSSMPWYQTTALWMAVHTFPWSRLSGAGLGIMPSDNVEMLKALGRDPQVIKQTRVDAVWGLVNLMDAAMAAAPDIDARLLVLYGANDQLIPPGAMREMWTRLPATADGRQRFVLYPHGWHMLSRDLQAKTVWRDIDAWISDPDAPFPSAEEVSSLPTDDPRAAVPENR